VFRYYSQGGNTAMLGGLYAGLCLAFLVFIYTTFKQLTYRSAIFMLDGLNDADSRMGVSFLPLFDIAAHLADPSCPKKNNFRGFNRHCSAKCYKY